MKQSGLARVMRELRMLAGFLFLVSFLVLARPTPLSIGLAMPLFAAGSAVRTWAAGHLVKRKELTVSGPYAYTQNPLYLGSFLLCIGACVAARSPWLPAVFLPAFAVIHVAVVRAERELARHHFGARFEEYASRVPAFLPSPRPHMESAATWSGKRYLANFEYNATVGVLAAMAFLLLRLAGKL